MHWIVRFRQSSDVQIGTLSAILLANLASGVLSLIGGFSLLANLPLAEKISHRLAAFAAGTLLGTAFLDLLPEAAAEGDVHEVLPWALVGILGFFLLERSVRWLHPRHEHVDAHTHEARLTVPLLMVGDTFHNFLDGLVIGTAFLVDMQIGVITAIAVAAHEIPQEIGDVAIMLHRKVSRKRIILFNLLSASASLFGGLLVYASGDALEPYHPALLALTAGLFTYIAVSDLMPEMQHEHRRRTVVVDTVLLILGVLAVHGMILALSGTHAH